MPSDQFMTRWALLDRNERDAAYNNAAAVPNSPALNNARIEASAAFRGQQGALLDVAYGSQARQQFDLFPAAEPNAPCFVFIHGGYWQRNRREDFCALGAGLQAHGWAVALPGYTLAPEATLAEIVAEVMASLDWLRREGPRHGVAGPVMISGWSAGGHLAALALEHPHVVAGLVISGVYELGPVRDTYLNHALKLSDSEVATLSPLRLPASNKPLDIAYGTRELPPLVDDSRALHALRASSHCSGALIPIAGADHFTILDELSSPAGLLVRSARNLMA